MEIRSLRRVAVQRVSRSVWCEVMNALDLDSGVELTNGGQD